MKNYLMKTIVVCVLFLVVLTGCFGKEREEVILTDKPADSGAGDVPSGWVKDTTELLYGLGKVTYVVPEYFEVPKGQQTSHDRYYFFDKSPVCHLSITGKLDAGGGPLPDEPLVLNVPDNPPYYISYSDKSLIVGSFKDGLEFWMRINKSEYAEQCGKDFVGFLNSIQYTPAQ